MVEAWSLTMHWRDIGRFREHSSRKRDLGFDLPDGHPDRMIAASIVLYVGLGIIIAITVWNHRKAAHP
jgi:hypothetical protein